MDQRDITATGAECCCRFNTQKAAAQHHHRSLTCQQLPDVSNAAKNPDAIRIDARNRGQTRLRTGGKHQLIPAELAPIGLHSTRGKIDLQDGFTVQERDAVPLIPRLIVDQGVTEGFFTGQHRRQQHAVVVAVRLAANDRDGVTLRRTLQQALHHLHPRHAITYHQQPLPHGLLLMPPWSVFHKENAALSGAAGGSAAHPPARPASAVAADRR